MYDYIFAIATPDLGAPMFGDASRDRRHRRPTAPTGRCTATLVEGTQLLGDPKYAARAKLQRDRPAGAERAMPFATPACT